MTRTPPTSMLQSPACSQCRPALYDRDDARCGIPIKTGKPMKKPLTVSAVALSLAGFADSAQAQLFFEGDLVRGAQQGAPGPFCVLNNQFKRLEKVVWRIRVLDHAGKSLDASGLKSLVIELPDGQKLNAR